MAKKAALAQNWQKTEFDTIDLQFDPINYRLPEGFKNKSQPVLYKELLKNYDVEEIAESISESGFYPHESLVIIKEGKKHVVIEGNRRLAACKALLLPDELDENLKKKYKKIAAITNLDLIKKLPVVIAPTRADAINLIESLHTQPGRKKWDTISKSRFDKDFRQDDKTKLAHANKVLDSYKVAASLNLPTNVKEVVLNESKFNVTNLMRILNDESCKTYLGYEFNESGNIIITTDAVEFQKAIIPIIEDVATHRSFSRLTDSPDDRKRYIADKKKTFEPDKTKKVKLTVDKFSKVIKDVAKAEDKKDSSTTEPEPKPKRTSKQKNVIPTDFKCTSKHKRLKEVFDELKELPIAFVNTSSIALRLLLEISIFNYLKGTGELKKLKADKVAEITKKNPNQKLSPEWTPELKEMLRWLIKADLIEDGHIVKLIHEIIDAKSENPVLYNLNKCVHNPLVSPTQEDVKQIWKKLQPVLEITLNYNEPTK